MKVQKIVYEDPANFYKLQNLFERSMPDIQSIRLMPIVLAVTHPDNL